MDINFGYDLFMFLLTSAAVAGFVSFFIQLGKSVAPTKFPDNSADTWRVALIVIIVGGAYGAKALNLAVDFLAVEAFITKLTNFGLAAFPLLVPVVSWMAKFFYSNVFKNLRLKIIGKSWTPPASTVESILAEFDEIKPQEFERRYKGK